MKFIVFTFCFIIISFVIKTIYCTRDEQRLYKDLMKNYNKLERPAENNSSPVIVKLGVVLNQIIDVVR